MYASGTMEAAQVVISLIPGVPRIDTHFTREALRVILLIFIWKTVILDDCMLLKVT